MNPDRPAAFVHWNDRVYHVAADTPTLTLCGTAGEVGLLSGGRPGRPCRKCQKRAVELGKWWFSVAYEGHTTDGKITEVQG